MDCDSHEIRYANSIVPLRDNQALQTEVDLRLEGQYSYTSLIPVADTIGLDAAPLNEFILSKG